MMTKPSITELDRSVDSRYTLVAMAAKRARMIGIERMENSDTDGYTAGAEKPVSQAVNEIADGIVGYVRSEAIEKAREYEEEKIIAISKLEKDSSVEEHGPEDDSENIKAELSSDEEESSADDDEQNSIDAALKLALEKNNEENTESE